MKRSFKTLLALLICMCLLPVLYAAATPDTTVADSNEPIFTNPTQPQPDVSLLATNNSVSIQEGSTYTLTVSGASGTVT